VAAVTASGVPPAMMLQWFTSPQSAEAKSKVMRTLYFLLAAAVM
jgi:hypothetical protein